MGFSIHLILLALWASSLSITLCKKKFTIKNILPLMEAINAEHRNLTLAIYFKSENIRSLKFEQISLVLNEDYTIDWIKDEKKGKGPKLNFKIDSISKKIRSVNPNGCQILRAQITHIQTRNNVIWNIQPYSILHLLV